MRQFVVLDIASCSKSEGICGVVNMIIYLFCHNLFPLDKYQVYAFRSGVFFHEKFNILCCIATVLY